MRWQSDAESSMPGTADAAGRRSVRWKEDVSSSLGWGLSSDSSPSPGCYMKGKHERSTKSQVGQQITRFSSRASVLFLKKKGEKES